MKVASNIPNSELTQHEEDTSDGIEEEARERQDREEQEARDAAKKAQEEAAKERKKAAHSRSASTPPKLQRGHSEELDIAHIQVAFPSRCCYSGCRAHCKSLL